MKKNEITKSRDNELITEYVLSYAKYAVNQNLGGREKRISAHCADLEKELVKRGILQVQDVERLNK